MRLFKACYRDRDGKARKSAKWYVEFRDHQTIRRRVPAFKNKTASSEFGHKLESLVACRIAGERPQGDLGKWLESLSAKIIAKLVSLGILEARRTAAGEPLSEHLSPAGLAGRFPPSPLTSSLTGERYPETKPTRSARVQRRPVTKMFRRARLSLARAFKRVASSENTTIAAACRGRSNIF